MLLFTIQTPKKKTKQNKKIQEYSSLARFTEELLLDSQCTVRVAEDEVTVSKLLLATHLYCPAFDCWTFVIVNWWFPSLEESLSRASAATFNPASFFVQATSGVGYPATTQLNTTVCPSTFVASTGDLEISGATININNEKEIMSLYRIKHNLEGVVWHVG